MADTSIDYIVNSKLPVLCLDTCIVLDLLRFPKDCARGVRMHTAARRILRAVVGQELVILIADQVRFELDNHLDQTEQRTSKDIEELRSRINVLEAVTAVYDKQHQTNLDHLDQYVHQARKLVNHYRKLATPAIPSKLVPGKALIRSNEAKTPARIGKAEIFDCVIIETYLEIADFVRERGHEKPVVFASSNVKDYGQIDRLALKPDLREEFDTVKMEYAPNLSAAGQDLGIELTSSSFDTE